MSEQKEDKTPEQVSDEDFKVAPTSADEKVMRNMQQRTEKRKGEEQAATGEIYKLPSENKVKEELREGVE